MSTSLKKNPDTNSKPFDIEALRANIGHDAEMECILLSSFVESCSESLRLLKDGFTNAENGEYNLLWQKHMHQIKGAALNLGARELSDFASEAQHQCGSAPATKKKLLAGIEQAFGRVEAYIAELL